MTYMHTYESVPIIKLNVDAIAAFYEVNFFHSGEMLSLADTRDMDLMTKLSVNASEAFSTAVSEIKKLLLDRSIGIAVLDIPVVYDDATDDAITGALLAVSLSAHIMPSRLDVENKMPFTMFSSSYESNNALNKAGLLHASPTNILNFHSDGAIDNNQLSVPDYISIYNIFINYRDRGNFYLVPSKSIPKFEEHVASIGLNDDYLFDLTPAIYGAKGSNGTEIKSISQRRARTSIFRRDADGEIITFMNGAFVGKYEGDTTSKAKLKLFQDDIGRNKFRYTVAQESRRMLFLNNAFGFHARDIFDDPIDGHEETRNYIRSVSQSDHYVGDLIANKK